MGSKKLARGSGCRGGRGEFGVWLELKDVLVGAQSLAGFVEEVSEVGLVSGVFFFDEGIEFLHLLIGVEIDGLHGLLGGGIDA